MKKQPALMIVIGAEGKSGPELSKKKPCPMCGCDCKSEMEEDEMDEESESELDDLLYKTAEKRKGLK